MVSSVQFARHKYWLLFEMLPMTTLCVVIRIILDYAGSFNGFFAISDVSTILTGGIFLIGFMLNGVIADYKEAEKLPGEIAGALGSIEEALVCIIPMKSKDARFRPSAIRGSLLQCTNTIFEWLARDDDALFATIGNIANEYTAPMYEAGPPVAVRLTQEAGRLRSAMTRVAVISHSTYLPAGYALVELFVLLAYITVILAHYQSSSVCYMAITGVTIIYGGMLRLLKDVDNPFEYEPIPEDAVAHGQSGSTEIDLSCLLDFRRNLKLRLHNDLASEQPTVKVMN